MGGEFYPRPPFAIDFDPDLPGWRVDEVAALAHAVAEKISAIDQRTDALLATGGMPFGGKRFALTDKARLNYQEVKAGLDEASLFQELGIISKEAFAAFFPVQFGTLDGGAYSFSNPMELRSFFLALATYQSDPASPYATGRTLKARVNAAVAAQSRTELEAIVDDRE